MFHKKKIEVRKSKDPVKSYMHLKIAKNDKKEIEILKVT